MPKSEVRKNYILIYYREMKKVMDIFFDDIRNKP